MTELQIRESEPMEVIRELEFRALQANEHYHNALRSMLAGIEEAIACGEHLAAARATFSEAQIAQGLWGDWLEKHFDAHRDTASRYIRLYRNKDSLPRRGSDPLSINQAIKMLAAPKEEKPEEGTQESEEQITIEDALTDESPTQQDTVDIAALRRARAKAEEKARKESEAREKALKKAEAATSEQRSLRKRVQELEEGHKALSHTMRENLKAQLADVYARHSIPEVPEIFQATPEEFQKALQGATTRREKEAVDILFEAMRVVGKMMNYEPEEAARAFLTWHSQDRSVRGIKQLTQWLEKCVQELEAQTTPRGPLRAIEN